MFRVITLQLNENCCLKCPYCFAGNHEQRRFEKKEISEEDFSLFLDFCHLNDIEMVRITGGEPFLHSGVQEILEQLDDFKLNIITNLVVPDCVEKMNPQKGKCAFLVNFNERNLYTEKQWESFLRNLEALKNRQITTVLGFNIYQRNYDLSIFLEKARELSCERIRLSIANPSFDGGTRVLRKEDISEVCHELVGLSKQLKKEGIEAFFDCPIMPCMMEFDDYKWLYENGLVRNECSSMCFIEKDLKISHCYTTDLLNDKPESLKNITTYEELRTYSEKLFTGYRNLVTKPEKCLNCTHPYKGDNLCGCFAFYPRTK